MMVSTLVLVRYYLDLYVHHCVMVLFHVWLFCNIFTIFYLIFSVGTQAATCSTPQTVKGVNVTFPR